MFWWEREDLHYREGRLIFGVPRSREVHIRQAIECELAIDLDRVHRGIGIRSPIFVELPNLRHSLVAGMRRHRIAKPPAAGHER